MDRRIARLFILDDVDNPNANVRQQVIVYDDMVEDLTPGALLQVGGEMSVERKAASGKNTKMDNVLHATSLKYLNKTEVVPTDDDIKNFYKWKQLCDKMAECPACLEWAKRDHMHPFKKTPMYTPITFIDRIVEMFAPNVVGHRLPKRGLSLHSWCCSTWFGTTIWKNTYLYGRGEGNSEKQVRRRDHEHKT